MHLRGRRPRPPTVPPGSPEAAAARLTAGQLDLVAEACRKSALLWLRTPGRQDASAAWHAWHDGRIALVCGGAEQQLPPLDELTAGHRTSCAVLVVVRSKDTGARLLTITCAAEAVAPQDERWDAPARALRAARLNATGDVLARWRSESTLVLLQPLRLVEFPGAYDDRSGAAPPRPSPGLRPVRRPWHLGGRRRSRRAATRHDGDRRTEERSRGAG